MHKLISTPLFLALALAPFAGAATPQLISLSPSSASGQTQTFTLTASDSAGAADIQSVDLMINSSFTGENGCWIAYDRTGGVTVASNAGTWGTGLNSQCTAHLVSANESGNDWSVAIAVNFDPNWTGGKSIWAAATDAVGNSSGYQELGSYTVAASGPVPDFTVSITPMTAAIQPGRGVHFKITATGINGFFGTVTFHTSANPNPHNLVVQDTRPDGAFGNAMYVPPTGTTNGGIWVYAYPDTPLTDDIVLTTTFTGGNIEHTVSVKVSVVSPSAPSVSLSPTSGSGSTQTFVITATDEGGGFESVGGINFLLNSSLSGANGCWLYYQPTQANGAAPSGNLSLASDDTQNWSQTTKIGAAATIAEPIHNSQCSIYGGTTTVQGSGDTLTLTVTLTFTSAFAGPKQAFVRASDVSGNDSTYQQLGTFTAEGASTAPDFVISASPGSQTVSGINTAAYSVHATTANGYTGTINLSVTGLPPDATLVPPGTIQTGVDYQSTGFSVQPAHTTPPGSYTLTITGTDETLTRSATTVLNIQAGDLPVMGVGPVRGSGASGSFDFFAAKQGDSFAPDFVTVLINNSVNGQGACWMYFNGTTLQLASDDGSAWQSFGANQSIHNSQCTISSLRAVQVSNGVRFQATIAFSESFAGNRNIYMYTAQDDQQTGYQYQGLWTVP